MSVQLAVMLAALVVVVVATAFVGAIAAVAAPRGITSGPTVTVARVLFLVALGALAVAIAALVWGLVTSWA